MKFGIFYFSVFVFFLWMRVYSWPAGQPAAIFDFSDFLTKNQKNRKIQAGWPWPWLAGPSGPGLDGQAWLES